MVVYLVLKSAAVLKRDRIHDEVAVQVVRVQMNGDDDLIFVAPHTTRGLLAYLERLLGSNFSLCEALKPVPRDDTAGFTESPFYRRHRLIRALHRAVDPDDE